MVTAKWSMHMKFKEMQFTLTTKHYFISIRLRNYKKKKSYNITITPGRSIISYTADENMKCPSLPGRQLQFTYRVTEIRRAPCPFVFSLL